MTSLRGDRQWGTTPRLVRAAAARFAGREALVDGDVRLSFPELADRVHEAAKAFIAAGVGPGDRIGIWAPNIGEWVIAAFGVQSVGAAIVPVNTRFKGREAAFVLGKSRARLLLTVHGFLDIGYVELLQAANESLPTLGQIVILRGDTPAGTVAWADFLAGGRSISDDDTRQRADMVGPDDVADIMFTSGTTGMPKGAMTTHAQLLRLYTDWSEIVGLTEGDRYLIAMPFFHTFGYKGGFVPCVMRGATIVPAAVFDPATTLATVERERISVLPGAPAMYQTILNLPNRDDDYDLSSLRLGVTGGAAVPVEMIKRMRSELTFKTIVTGYGLTETSGTATMCRPDDDPETIARSCGRAVPDVEVRVVDDAGREVPRGEPGEVVVRGYNVMLGYLDEREETAGTIDPDGWLHTGDIGVMDGRGYLTITDRKKDMFIVGGFNAYPAEIENQLLAHPAVAQAAVVGMPDERLGEVGCAFVVARAGATVHPDELIGWARDQMANFKVPRRVVVVDALPLNASGKVLKYELRQRAAG